MRRILELVGSMVVILYGEMAVGLTLKSLDFDNDHPIPDRYTCIGKDQIPKLVWSNPPKNTQSLVLIVEDPDSLSGTWTHWIVFNIPSSFTQLPSNQVDSKMITGTNSWGQSNYRGPCPPAGKLHHYIFTLYALDNSLDLSDKATAQAVKSSISSHTLSKTKLVGTYQRR